MRNLFSDLASSPDARFIYEAIDAANSLLGTLNSFVDPTTGLRYMPLKYYLYVIYAAVFLFKARAAGALGGDSDGIVRRAIKVTISRFQKSSVHPHSPGYRYARLLYLLWRKPWEQKKEATNQATSQKRAAPQDGADDQLGAGNAGESLATGLEAPTAMLSSLDQFSWRDLDAVGQFIGSDGSIPDSMLASPGLDLDPVAAGLDAVSGGTWFDGLMAGNDFVF